MNRHTPGPWRIAGSTYGERWIVDSESPKTGKQNIIAMLQDHWKGNANGYMDANACLIAAAPLMLEALVRLCEAARALDEQISTVHNKIIITDAVSLLRLQNDALSAVKQAEAAIAAAKGEA